MLVRKEYLQKKAFPRWAMDLDNQWRTSTNRTLRPEANTMPPTLHDEADELRNGERAGEPDEPQLSEVWVPPKEPGAGSAANGRSQDPLHVIDTSEQNSKYTKVFWIPTHVMPSQVNKRNRLP